MYTNEHSKLPSEDTQSVAASNAPLLPGQANGSEERTTLTGKPIRYEHDTATNVMLGDGGGFASTTAGANLLPPGYTDRSLVRIPIKLADVGGQDAIQGTAEIKAEKKRGFLSKLTTKKDARDDMKVVMMSRGDYLKYWAKGPDGKYLDTVLEPPEGRQEWFRQQLVLNEEMKRNDPSLGKSKQSPFANVGIGGMGA